MIKIGITGSLASGKTTASNILSYKRGPLFSADKAVQDLYKNKSFKNIISEKFNIENNNKTKKSLKKLILNNRNYITKLERIIHPLIRKKMKKFTIQNKNSKKLFYEIPLLIESRLMNYFDVIIFIKAPKKIRLKRFELKRGDKDLFKLLDNRQMAETKKIKFCDHVIVNVKNLKIFKKNLLTIITKYE